MDSKVGEKVKGFLEKMQDNSGNTKVLWIIVQVALGVLLVYVIYLLALLAIRADKLGIDEKKDITKKRMVTIIDGYSDSSLHAGELGKINTTVEAKPDFVPIRPSVNLRGGSQFSYSLWLSLSSTDYVKDDIQNKCIFLKGDDQKYNFEILTNKITDKMGTEDRITFCPMLCFGAHEMEFFVYFNTLHNMKETFEVRKYDSENSATRHNLLNLYSKKWIMITIVFEDNIPINDFENGILVKFYINDLLYQTGRFASALRQNNGLLYLFPDGPIPNCRFADFVYYNYAVTEDEIKKKSDMGPSTKPSIPPNTGIVPSSWISDYNRLDIYNT